MKVEDIIKVTGLSKKEIENFYKSLSLLNDDMVLTDITEKPRKNQSDKFLFFPRKNA